MTPAEIVREERKRLVRIAESHGTEVAMAAIGYRKPALLATHRCKLCGASWRLNPPTKVQPEGSWSLVSKSCGKCCDNVAMGEQIERLPEPR